MDMSWNTIDSDPAVFTDLVLQLGVRDIQFDEIYTLDEISSHAPVYGVVFLFKYYSSSYQQQVASDQSTNYDSSEKLYFARQLIQNACATQAVLNILLNKDDAVDIGPELKNFKEFTESFDSGLKGETISNSDLIRTIHNSFSSPNPFMDDEEVHPEDVDPNNDGLFHFIGYIEKDGRIYELDGLRPHPVDHGAVEGGDVNQKLIQVIQDKISTFNANELRFSLQVITSDKLKENQQKNDAVGAQEELAKRKRWQRENLLRKQDLIGLNYEVIKLISSSVSDREWEKLKDSARVDLSY